MYSSIRLKTGKVHASIGVTDEERSWPQQLMIDLAFSYDISAAAANDDFRQAIDYEAVWDVIREYVSTSSFQLIETLASRLQQHLIENFPIQSLELTISKPGALRSKNVDCVSITVNYQAEQKSES